MHVFNSDKRIRRRLPGPGSMNAIYVMTDQTGSWPVLRSDPLPPRNLPGRRTWRFVARVDDRQIVPMLTALLRKREAGEL